MSSDENRARRKQSDWGGAAHRDVNLKTGMPQRDQGAQGTPSLLASLQDLSYAPRYERSHGVTNQV
jgi:hypothetical protein